jgi:hypothetical protein
MSPPVPHRLDPHTSISFQTDLISVLRSVLSHGCRAGTGLVPFVDLATGRVRGKVWKPHDDWWRKAATQP